MLEWCVFGIEIDQAPVGTREIVDATHPDVQRDRAEVYQIDQCFDDVRDEILDVALRVFTPDRDRLNPIRDEARRVFLVERLAVDPVGIAGEHDRAVLEIRQEPGRHRPVVLDQVALGIAFLGPEDFVQVRQLDFSGRRDGGRGTGGSRLGFTRPPSLVPRPRHHHIFGLLIIPKAHENGLP